MIAWLLGIGLVVTPFILAPGSGNLSREPKMAWAVSFALAIGLTALYKGVLKPFKNKGALALVGYALLSFFLSPKPQLALFGIESGRFWSWEPMFYILTFLLMTVAVSSIGYTKKTLHITFDVMIWCATLMAGLVIIQFLGIDQFFERRFGTYGHMVGTLGNYTLVGPFLTIVAPLAIYRKKYALMALMVIAAVVTQSDVARVGMLAMFACYFALKNKKRFVSTAVVVYLAVGILGTMYNTSETVRQRFPDNERFLTAYQSIHDLTTPVMEGSKKKYSITGIGIGSFKYLFHAKNNQRNDNFLYAHNEYVQVLYEMGIAGFLFFMGMMGLIFRQNTSMKEIFSRGVSNRKRALLSSFVGISVCAAGIFIWQIGTHIFYTLTIVGLLYNKSVCAKEDICQQ
ncbi:MAG: O-antigen ligase family protein [Candidatus Aadella gelida]|nr:O-antigen ligase family protein [Candidatus Aadella gelida]